MAVISKQADIRMTSASVGVTDPGEQWDLDVKWAVHMTLSGTFTHAAPWNNSLGKANNSHGCVNMSDTDAKWFYDRAVTGDPIEVKGSKPDKVVDPGNGYGAFTLTWDEWKAKSALAA
jgi:lipoprotein-anchoring transpeptidase ErfK/SrfK